MAETAPRLPQTSQLGNDRRKLQNRIAQRRFRQKKAMEARVANHQIDGQWHDLLNFTPHFHPTTPLGGRPGSEAPTALVLANRGSAQPTEQDVSMWDSQLFSDVFFLNQVAATAEIAAPTAPAIPLSPPSSTTSSASPGHSQPNDTSDPTKTADQQENTPLDGNALLRVACAGAASDAARLTNGAANSIAPTIQLSEQLRAQVRNEMAAEWKAGPKNPRPTWGRKDEPWEPLLHTAAKKGNCEIVQMLLAHNADINERNSSGMTALHLAIEYQQEDVIMILLGSGVDINATDNEGRTALSMAVNNSCESGVRLFLLHGADPMIKSASSRESTSSP
ncbi:ankyrin repeat-containing domain protein [Lasiosphaeris hirsuta]|uniref:Ankyrin repeat-containing domain protein n=1 Tax=Lasiosphaeris hirsuta TaxID=260670 RepID=A0AA39ZRM7_9PEZI|nr:ankyrin repeat-containing domain protein [Lasiosphaeris hirsuta]